jgi:hypothetical protein
MKHKVGYAVAVSVVVGMGSACEAPDASPRASADAGSAAAGVSGAADLTAGAPEGGGLDAAGTENGGAGGDGGIAGAADGGAADGGAVGSDGGADDGGMGSGAVCSCTLTSVCSQGTLLVLTPAKPSLSFNADITAPGYDVQGFTKYDLDVSAFASGGTIRISGAMGSGVSAGSFDLFPACLVFPIVGRPAGTLGGAYDIPRLSPWAIRGHVFAAGEGLFHFGAEGNWFSPTGSMNTVTVMIEVTQP